MTFAQGPHFFVEPQRAAGDEVVLDGPDGRHLAVVLRARVGDPVTVADGVGAVLSTRVRRVKGAEVRLEVLDRAQALVPRPRVTVVHALPKGRKLDDVVTRLSEVGVERLVPVMSARSQVALHGDRAAKAVARWRAVALAAGKQSRRARLMEIAPVGGWDEAFAPGPPGVVLWEEATSSFRAALSEFDDPDELWLGIGPEGGLTADEVARTGLPDASLGPTILRTETAALVAVSIAMAAFGRLG